MAEPYHRLQTARSQAGFESATEAARAHGWNQNTYRSHENGERGLKKAVAEKYAKAFQISTAWLLTGEGGARKKHTVAVLGRITSGGAIVPAFHPKMESLYHIEVHLSVKGSPIAFEIEGKSLWPRYEPGDVIICAGENAPIEQVLGSEAAVRTSERTCYLKHVYKGSKRGHYDLVGFEGASICDVKLDWIGQVLVVLRASQVQRIDQEAGPQNVKRPRRPKAT